MICTQLVVALTFGAVLGHFERNPTEVERLASELIELKLPDLSASCLWRRSPELGE